MSSKDESKRYHIVSDAEFGWHESFVESFDCEIEEKKRRSELSFICDPYEVLTVKDTLEEKNNG